MPPACGVIKGVYSITAKNRMAFSRPRHRFNLIDGISACQFFNRVNLFKGLTYIL